MCISGEKALGLVTPNAHLENLTSQEPFFLQI